MANVPKDVATSVQAIPAFALPKGGAQDERELVRMAQNGTAEAFEELVRRHQQRVFAVVTRILHRREDVEDVSQQVFLKAYVSIRRFDMRSAFSTWLYKIAVNECWDSLRKKKVRPLVYESDLSEEQVQLLDSYAQADRGPAGHDEQIQARDLAERLLSSLSDEDREILLLKEVEGLSVQEIAEIFELNVNTVKVRMFRARANMMEAYRRKLTGAVRSQSKDRRG
ncbi:MAG: sigma-70 family RNA polymerase sigma factor [Candidatus Acidiferrales bacterium]|jgi:RNA polymerase sigma-70 factor (ECF subfamily)